MKTLLLTLTLSSALFAQGTMTAPSDDDQRNLAVAIIKALDARLTAMQAAYADRLGVATQKVVDQTTDEYNALLKTMQDKYNAKGCQWQPVVSQWACPSK